MKPVALVSMPTLSAQYPSFQLGLLKPTLEKHGIPAQAFSLFMYFGRHIGWPIAEALAGVDPTMSGEWVWSKAAFGPSRAETDAAYFKRYETQFASVCEQAGCTLADLKRVRDVHAFEFLDWALESTDWSRFGLVGFTICFQQMVASLAFAKRLKEKHPGLPIIFGGATFEDDIAQEIFAQNPQVDFLLRGDGDLAFPAMVKRLYGGESMRGAAGLLWRDGGKVVDNGRAPNLEDLNLTPVPEFDEYFHARKTGGYDAWPDARLAMIPIETARGCWYGMKNHCTFCGLNRAGMDFRAKKPEQVRDLLKVIVRRYGTLHINAIDNILAPEYATELFGKLAEDKTDLKLHYEIRPNLNRAQLRKMHEGGLASVQPGVESFSTHVLTLMKKFTTGVRNLELIKWTTYYGIANYYNILTGFAGETAEDYREQAEVIRKIFHFEPPYAICEARPDRGSPMFERPAEHSVKSLTPSACYRAIYPEHYDLTRAAYYFDYQKEGLPPSAAYDACYELVAEWKRAWASERRPTLTYRKAVDSIGIADGRGEKPVHHRYDDRVAALYEFCADARRKEDIATHFKGDDQWVDRALEEFCARDLMLHLDGKYLALALPENRYQ